MSNDLPEMVERNLDDTSEFARVYDTVLGLRKPADIDDICSLALSNKEITREVLDVLEEIGAVEHTREDGSDKYCRKEEFVKWLRVSKLRDQNTKQGLSDFLDDVEEEISLLQDTYNVDHPNDVALPKGSEALIQKVESDVERWFVLLQTKDDIEVAQRLEDE